MDGVRVPLQFQSRELSVTTVINTVKQQQCRPRQYFDTLPPSLPHSLPPSLLSLSSSPLSREGMARAGGRGTGRGRPRRASCSGAAPDGRQSGPAGHVLDGGVYQ